LDRSGVARNGMARPRSNFADVADLIHTTVPMMLSRIVLQIGSNLEVALVSRLEVLSRLQSTQ